MVREGGDSSQLAVAHALAGCHGPTLDGRAGRRGPGGAATQFIREHGCDGIRAGDVVIAEHREAASRGQCVVDKEHMAELWRVTDEQTARPPAGGAAAAGPDVMRADLTRYEEVAG